MTKGITKLRLINKNQTVQMFSYFGQTSSYSIIWIDMDLCMTICMKINILSRLTELQIFSVIIYDIQHYHCCYDVTHTRWRPDEADVCVFVLVSVSRSHVRFPH